ncbi:hypothetical protein ES703_109133 [subsurface metagenome]
MNIKFDRVSWAEDSKELMCVIFRTGNGKELKWYPKWGDVAEVFRCAFATESSNEGRLTNYLLFIALNTIMSHLIMESGGDISKYNETADTLELEFLQAVIRQGR